jgi:hypothetical protein
VVALQGLVAAAVVVERVRLGAPVRDRWNA